MTASNLRTCARGALLGVLFLVTGPTCGLSPLPAPFLGTVTDSTGAVVPGAAITITNIATNTALSAKSNASGEFTFPVVSPGTYKASAARQGFATLNQNDIRLSANQSINVPLCAEERRR